MQYEVELAGRTLRPRIVSFPIVLYAATVGCFLLFARDADPFWFRVGRLTNMVAVCAAVIGSVPGLVDWITGEPERTPARSPRAWLVLFDVVALVVFAANLVLVRGSAQVVHPEAWRSVLLTSAGLASTLGAGFLGWRVSLASTAKFRAARQHLRRSA